MFTTTILNSLLVSVVVDIYFIWLASFGASLLSKQNEENEFTRKD